MKSETNALKSTILTQANGIKKKIVFWYYRIAKGIARILSYAKEGVRLYSTLFFKKSKKYWNFSFGKSIFLINYILRKLKINKHYFLIAEVIVWH